MANLYDNLHDNAGVSRLPDRISRRNAPGLFLMDIQLILSLILGLCACLYIGLGIREKFQQSDNNPQCGECNAEENIIQTDK